MVVHGGQHPRHYKGQERGLLMDKGSEESFIIGPMVSGPQTTSPLFRGNIICWKYHLRIIEWKGDGDHGVHSLRPSCGWALHFIRSFVVCTSQLYYLEWRTAIGAKDPH